MLRKAIGKGATLSHYLSTHNVIPFVVVVGGNTTTGEEEECGAGD